MTQLVNSGPMLEAGQAHTVSLTGHRWANPAG